MPDRGRTLGGRHAHAVVLSRSASATRSGSRTPCITPAKGVLKKDTIKPKRDSSVRTTSISAEELLEQALKDSKKRIAEKPLPIPLPDHLPIPSVPPIVLQPVNVASGTVTVPNIPKVPIFIPNVPPLPLSRVISMAGESDEDMTPEGHAKIQEAPTGNFPTGVEDGGVTAMVGVALPETAEGIQTGVVATDSNAAVREAAREQFQRAEQAECAWSAEMEMRQHYQQSTAHLKADNAVLHENLHNVVEQGEQRMQQVMLEGNIRLGQERATADARVADVFVQGRNEFMNLQNQQQQDANVYREHMEHKQAELNAAYLESHNQINGHRNVA